MIDHETYDENVISIDGERFDASDLGEAAKIQLKNLQFVDELIMQKNNELQISDSARIMYTSAFKSEIINSN